MALSASSLFASFDITDKTQELDISPVLLSALMVDTGVLGAIPMGSPVYDTTHYWNEIALNSATVTVDSTGYASNVTTVVLASGHGARLRVGALVKRLGASAEVAQVTAISGDTLTVTRGYESTAAATATFAADAVLHFWMPLQEGSDIDVDRTVAPSVVSNYTEIFGTDIKISRNQLKRRMAAIGDFLAQSLHDRTMEIKRELELAVIHGIKSSSAGSDSVYRSMGGLIELITQTDATSEAFAYAVLNDMVQSVVDAGGADAQSKLVLVTPTQVRRTISGFDSSNRRLVESDRRVGYFVEQVETDLGILIDLVISNYLGTASPYTVILTDMGRVSLKPFADDTFKLLAAEDFTDGVKRRIIGEYTLELRNADSCHYTHSALTA